MTAEAGIPSELGSPENVPVLIGLLNAILKLPRPIVHVEVLNPFSYQEFADDKLVVLDVRARDAAGRWLNVEMQVTVFTGLVQRLVYYACTMYVDQLGPGQSYADLRPAISICLLDKTLFRDDAVPHHRFRLADPEHGMEVSDAIGHKRRQEPFFRPVARHKRVLTPFHARIGRGVSLHTRWIAPVGVSARKGDRPVHIA